MKVEPEIFFIGNGSEVKAVVDRLGDWLFEMGFGEASPDLGHQVYTRCKFVFGEGQYRINGGNLERFGSAWVVVVSADEVEQFLMEGE